MLPKISKLLPIVIIVITLVTLGVLRLTNKESIPHYKADSSAKTLSDFLAESHNLKPQLVETQEQTVTFLAVGDISLSRNIAATIKAKNDVLYPFRRLDELLRSTDFNFGNLETPFSKTDIFTAKNTLVFNAPKTNVAGLKDYNFAVLNLANNHALDQATDGVDTTSKILNENGLLHMGTGKNLDEAWKPAIIEKNGIKIGFIGASYSSVNDGGKTKNDYVARIEDVEHLKSAINNLKSTIDFLVVTMHAGTEYTATANEAQIKFAHAAIDAGADIVIGAHPHWVQNKEVYKGKTIYYSLGNFIFDQNWSEQTKKGLALKITLSKLSSNNLNSSTSTPNNAATLSDLQPAGTKPNTEIKNIEEIPIFIQDNCCATLGIKK